MIEQLNQLSQELAQRRAEFQRIKDKVKQLEEAAKQISTELKQETDKKIDLIGKMMGQNSSLERIANLSASILVILDLAIPYGTRRDKISNIIGEIRATANSLIDFNRRVRRENL